MTVFPLPVMFELHCLVSLKVDLKFQAPYKAKTYHYTVTLRSDSYLDLDVHQNFNVSKAPKSAQRGSDILITPETLKCE